MAKARMLHKKISTSGDVSRLSLPARLLFTWMIAHADDEGRLKGEPSFIKVAVVPYTNWSQKLIERYLNQMKDVGLIYYWQENNQRFIEFPKWNEYQSIRKDRFEPSKLPTFNNKNDNQVSTKRQPNDNQTTPQANISESNSVEFNKSEYNDSLADKKTFKSTKDILNPNRYVPKNKDEVAAKETWLFWEPNNSRAFYSTYLHLARKGLPSSYFYQFTSEMKVSRPKNPGAVFNAKAKDYFEKHGLQTK